MSWLETNTENNVEEFQLDAENNTNNMLFLGDEGELALETRRVLVHLLIGPTIDGHLHSKLWTILRRDEGIIRKRLADLFLTLVIDADLQVAFTQQADTGDLETPKLLRRTQLTFIDSVLLLYLRQYLTQSEARGERAVITTDEMIDHLSLYAHHSSTDHAGFRKRSLAAIEKSKKQRILRKIQATENRFEISPSLKILFSAEEIQALYQLYQQMLSKNEKIIEMDAQS